MCGLLDRTVELASSDYDLRKKYDFRHIDIVREYQANIPAVQCEETNIQQVFLNILKNGAQAMAGYQAATHYKPRFTLRVKRNGEMVRVEIGDNGPGMEEEVRKRVFEPFYSTKSAGLGTGLGLSISYFIITHNYHGTIAVESAPGKGTNFIIQLPLPKPGS